MMTRVSHRGRGVATALLHAAEALAVARGRTLLTLDTATEEGASAHIDSLAKKYLDKDKYPWGQPGEQRVIFEIEPQKVQGS